MTDKRKVQVLCQCMDIRISKATQGGIYLECSSLYQMQDQTLNQDYGSSIGNRPSVSRLFYFTTHANALHALISAVLIR